MGSVWGVQNHKDAKGDMLESLCHHLYLHTSGGFRLLQCVQARLMTGPRTVENTDRPSLKGLNVTL